MALTESIFNSKKIKNVITPQVTKWDIIPTAQTAEQLARKILAYVMQFRRIADPNNCCANTCCEACLSPHLRQVKSAIETQQPISFVLPAFPAKSPNPAKVLGPLPDMAEQLSLEFLNLLCQQIQEIYSVGARIILCSDGRVFNDVLGISNKNVTNYQWGLAQLINEKSFSNISMFNLDDMYTNQNFTEMRQQLMEQYSESLESIKDAVRQGSRAPHNKANEETHRQYCGITRFLVEDAMYPGQTLSRSAIQKACRERAYVVIQRSRAWSALLAKQFPDAVRLSIHPQTCRDAKLGIRLLEAESWMTPWHGVAVDLGEGFVLLKRAQAEELGARLIYRHNRPSHYELVNNDNIVRLKEFLYGI